MDVRVVLTIFVPMNITLSPIDWFCLYSLSFLTYVLENISIPSE